MTLKITLEFDLKGQEVKVTCARGRSQTLCKGYGILAEASRKIFYKWHHYILILKTLRKPSWKDTIQKKIILMPFLNRNYDVKWQKENSNCWLDLKQHETSSKASNRLMSYWHRINGISLLDVQFEIDIVQT